MKLKLIEFIYDKKYVFKILVNNKKLTQFIYLFRVIRKNLGYSYNLLKN